LTHLLSPSASWQELIVVEGLQDKPPLGHIICCIFLVLHPESWAVAKATKKRYILRVLDVSREILYLRLGLFLSLCEGMYPRQRYAGNTT